jgi:hypothetical protein
MKSELLDQLIELAERQARLVLLKLKLPLMPAWVLMNKSGQPQIVATPWQDEQEKQLYAAMMRALMRKEGIVAYSFLCEAWTRTLEPQEWDKANDRPFDGIEPRNHPERQEVIIACACSKDLSRWKRWRIVREATTEVIIGLKDDPWPQSDIEPDSWMSDMLK